jgi:hypothetical protein
MEAHMPLMDDRNFREWLRVERGVDLSNHDLKVHMAGCEGCGGTGFPIFGDDNQCLVCIAGDYGRALANRRITDTVRDVIGLIVSGPPEVASRLLVLVVDGLEEAVDHLRMEAGDGGAGLGADSVSP